MPYTNPSLVAGVIEVDEEEVPDLTPFIEDANQLVIEFCVKTPPIYSDARLRRIETYLAAHFYNVRDRRSTSERAAEVQESFESGKTHYGLMLTWYGQQAMLLDTKGALAALNSSTQPAGGDLVHRRIGIAWLGSPDYRDHVLDGD